MVFLKCFYKWLLCISRIRKWDALSEETYMTSQTARDLLIIQKQMIGLWSPELSHNQDPLVYHAFVLILNHMLDLSDSESVETFKGASWKIWAWPVFRELSQCLVLIMTWTKSSNNPLFSLIFLLSYLAVSFLPILFFFYQSPYFLLLVLYIFIKLTVKQLSN